MHVPLLIDDASYQDLAVREGNSYIILLEFIDSEGNYLDVSEYNLRLLCFTKGRQTTPAIEFSSNDFTHSGLGTVLWNIDGSKTINKQGSYIYHADLTHVNTGKEATYMYGMFTVINKNG